MATIQDDEIGDPRAHKPRHARHDLIALYDRPSAAANVVVFDGGAVEYPAEQFGRRDLERRVPAPITR